MASHPRSPPDPGRSAQGLWEVCHSGRVGALESASYTEQDVNKYLTNERMVWQMRMSALPSHSPSSTHTELPELALVGPTVPVCPELCYSVYWKYPSSSTPGKP